MTDRTIFDEIRRVRHEVSAKIGHDPQRILDYYRVAQERVRDRLVDLGADQSAARDATASAVTETVAK
jgi:hypothetical protein